MALADIDYYGDGLSRANGCRIQKEYEDRAAVNRKCTAVHALLSFRIRVSFVSRLPYTEQMATDKTDTNSVSLSFQPNHDYGHIIPCRHDLIIMILSALRVPH